MTPFEFAHRGTPRAVERSISARVIDYRPSVVGPTYSDSILAPRRLHL
jgi:hypothetical protein